MSFKEDNDRIIKKRIKDAMFKVAAIIQADAIKRCQAVTGRLRRSIKIIRADENGAEVGSDLDYACVIGANHSVYSPKDKASYRIGTYKPMDVLSKDGKTHKMTKALLPAKRQLAKQLLDIKDKVGSLVGMPFTLKRYGTKDASCGIILDYEKDKIYKLKGDWTVPYDYEKVLRPLSDDELRSLGFIPTKIIGDSVDPIDNGLELELESDSETKKSEPETETSSNILDSLEDVLSEGSETDAEDDIPF